MFFRFYSYLLQNLIVSYRDDIGDVPLTQIFREAIEVEKQFASHIFKNGNFFDITLKQMHDYVEHVAAVVNRMTGYRFEKKSDKPLENPLPFMNMYDVDTKHNFFEVKATEYTNCCGKIYY